MGRKTSTQSIYHHKEQLICTRWGPNVPMGSKSTTLGVLELENFLEAHGYLFTVLNLDLLLCNLSSSRAVVSYS